MRCLGGPNRQAGFTLLNAIFLLVVLALLAAGMVKLALQQSWTGSLALQSARVYQAAGGGLEWGIAEALNSGNCNASNPSFDILGFQVAVACQADGFSEGGVGYTVYRVSATASQGSYGSPSFVSRSLEAKLTSYSGP